MIPTSELEGYIQGKFAKHIRENTTAEFVERPADGRPWVCVTTPFLDRHNDQIQLLVLADDELITGFSGGFTLLDEENGLTDRATVENIGEKLLDMAARIVLSGDDGR